MASPRNEPVPLIGTWHAPDHHGDVTVSWPARATGQKADWLRVQYPPGTVQRALVGPKLMPPNALKSFLIRYRFERRPPK
jgi:hypothetical protein